MKHEEWFVASVQERMMFQFQCERRISMQKITVARCLLLQRKKVKQGRLLCFLVWVAVKRSFRHMSICLCVCVSVSPLHKSVPLSMGNGAVGGWRSGWGQGAAV